MLKLVALGFILIPAFLAGWTGASVIPDDECTGTIACFPASSGPGVWVDGTGKQDGKCKCEGGAGSPCIDDPANRCHANYGVGYEVPAGRCVIKDGNVIPPGGTLTEVLGCSGCDCESKVSRTEYDHGPGGCAGNPLVLTFTSVCTESDCAERNC